MRCAILVVIFRMQKALDSYSLNIIALKPPSSTAINESAFNRISSKECLIHIHNNMHESQNNFAECQKARQPPPKSPHGMILLI